MTITIPEKLEALVKSERSLLGTVAPAFDTYEEVLNWSKLPFFPDYTDHGPKHIAEVLATAEELISEESWERLTPADAACLCLSVLFHDLGMHLSEDGFLALTGDPSQKILVPTIDHDSWIKLWSDFLSESKRFDGKTLMRVYGDTGPATDPPRDSDLLTKRDRKLIGEFIRRHHPRLAHEFAIAGLIGMDGARSAVPGSDTLELFDLAGVVARSHGSDLRISLPYLEQRYSQTAVAEYQGVHAVFLMVVLRISDYIQIHGSRAPRRQLTLHPVSTEFSLREWQTHAAVCDISRYHDDPEAIFVTADPRSVDVYLKLNTLLVSIQRELDHSWGVLGEIYGRRPPLNRLGLTVRRIRSNIDTPEGLKDTSFVPCHAAFDTAGAELLKLLAQPLYGDDPNYAVRELLQNAIDACRELQLALVRAPKTIPQFDQPTDIVVALERTQEGPARLRVSDKGIGMTVDVLRYYFLKAGATYRRSMEWQKQFEDEKGHSLLLRSGRFGIGVLAAFILGETITVRTRHISSQRGVEFSATIDVENIELRYIDMPVGTEIHVRLTESAAKRLDALLRDPKDLFGCLPSGLYLLRSPSLTILNGDSVVERHDFWPSPSEETLPAGWNRIKPSGFEEVHWTYMRTQKICCNGIAVSRPLTSEYQAPSGTYQFTNDNREFSPPTISVFDPDGYFPLTLDRTALSRPYLNFESDLARDIYRDIAACVIAQPLHMSEDPIPSVGPAYAVDHPALSWTGPPICFFRDRFSVFASDLVHANDPEVLHIFYFANTQGPTPLPPSSEAAVQIQPRVTGRLDRDDAIRRAVRSVNRVTGYAGKRVVGVRIFATELLHRQLQYRVSSAIRSALKLERVVGPCRSLIHGQPANTFLSIEEFMTWAKPGDHEWDQPILVQYYLQRAKLEPPQTLLGKYFREDVGAVSLPYSWKERSKLPGFASLQRRISFHQKRLREKEKSLGR